MKKAHPLEGPIEKGDSSERTDRKKHPFLQVNQLGNSWMSVAIRHWLGALVQDTTCVVAPAPPPRTGGIPLQGLLMPHLPLAEGEWEVPRMRSLPV